MNSNEQSDKEMNINLQKYTIISEAFYWLVNIDLDKDRITTV